MAKAKKLPRIVDQVLFGAIDVEAIKELKAEGQSKESLIGSIEEDLEALVDAIDTGREFTDTRWPTIKKRLEVIGARQAKMGRKKVIVSDTGPHRSLPGEYAQVVFYPGPQKATMAVIQKL